MKPFFQLFQQLAREGPGEDADVFWATEMAGAGKDARICDVACGSGANIAPLLAACPDGHVTAFDKQAHFIDEARHRVGDNAQVALSVGDMAQLNGSYDFVWCAGAIYFLGIKAALKQWRAALNQGGAIAFSLPCWWVDTPSKPAQDLWAQYSAMCNEAGLADQVQAAGYKTIATRRLADSAWEGFYTPLESRINLLRDTSDQALQTVLDEEAKEIAIWRAHGDEYGYLLTVVRPI